MTSKHMRNKEAFFAFLRSRGIEPDLRQEGRSLTFATFPVISEGMDSISKKCGHLLDFFIETTANHKFKSRIAHLTFSPVLCEIGPPCDYDFRLTHKHSEAHVFASAVIDTKQWRRLSTHGRHIIVISSLIECIERIKSNWITDEDRANLMGVFLCLK